MYFDDAPIKKQDDDLLNRREFASRIGKSLLETEAPNGYCVGLFGPWGSGKSSLINMITEEIKGLSKLDEKKAIIMSFNPWNFSSEDQLLRQYFIMLANRFTSNHDKQLSKIGKQIQNYAGMFNVFGNVGKVIGGGWRMFAKKLQKKNISEEEDITEQRDRIIEALSKQNCKIIVVIDDIDRLSNEEIKLVFKLVNSVAKFPNIIYLLSFDKEIVARALEEVQKYDGEKYLEKIIQVPIEIPNAQRDYLWNILFERLDDLLKRHPGMLFEQEYWNRIFLECVSKHVHTLRDVVRLINGLSIKCDMIGNEINYADIVAITVIENKIPELYRWVKNNKAMLVGAPEFSLKFIGKDDKEIAKLYREEMERLFEEKSEEYINLLKVMFPYYASKIGATLYGTNDTMRRGLRVGHEDMFDRYFILGLDSEDVSRKEFNFAIGKMDRHELEMFFLSANKNKQIINCLKELRAMINEVSQERIEVIVKALFNVAVEFEGENRKSFLGVSALSLALYTARDLLKNLKKEEERFLLLRTSIENANYKSIQSLSYFLNLLELAHGRLAANGVENGSEKLIELFQLKECERVLVEKIAGMSTEHKLLEMKYARFVLYMYESLDNEKYLDYMSMALKDDLNKLRLVAFSTERWTSGSGVSWKQNEEYKKLLSEDDVEAAIKLCLENKSIWSLSEEFLHRIIAWILWKERNVDWDGEVPDKKVEERINELQKKFL